MPALCECWKCSPWGVFCPAAREMDPDCSHTLAGLSPYPRLFLHLSAVVSSGPQLLSNLSHVITWAPTVSSSLRSCLLRSPIVSSPLLCYNKDADCCIVVAVVSSGPPTVFPCRLNYHMKPPFSREKESADLFFLGLKI